MMRPCYAVAKIGRFCPKAGGIIVGAGTAVFAFFLSRTSAPASVDEKPKLQIRHHNDEEMNTTLIYCHIAVCADNTVESKDS